MQISLLSWGYQKYIFSAILPRSSLKKKKKAEKAKIL